MRQSIKDFIKTNSFNYLMSNSKGLDSFDNYSGLGHRFRQFQFFDSEELDLQAVVIGLHLGFQNGSDLS